MRLDPERAGHDRQSLASALRDLRRAAGLSGERLALTHAQPYAEYVKLLA